MMQPRFKFVENMPRQDSSGWILQVFDQKYNLEIDIMINKTCEIHNSLLIKEYCDMDKRFHKIMLFLKKWNNGLSSHNFDKLNNFTIGLMLIAFMQREKMMPNLQAMSQNHINLMRTESVTKTDYEII